MTADERRDQLAAELAEVIVNTYGALRPIAVQDGRIYLDHRGDSGVHFRIEIRCEDVWVDDDTELADPSWMSSDKTTGVVTDLR